MTKYILQCTFPWIQTTYISGCEEPFRDGEYIDDSGLPTDNLQQAQIYLDWQAEDILKRKLPYLDDESTVGNYFQMIPIEIQIKTNS